MAKEKKQEKKVKNYIYEGLGFPVVLETAKLRKVRNKWCPQIDIEAVAKVAFKMLPAKPSKLTGLEIRFIRTYLDKSKPAFAEIFKLSHTAVTKWEKARDQVAPISPSQEIALRLYLEDYQNVGVREFYKAYKEIENSVFSIEDKPLKIAI